MFQNNILEENEILEAPLSHLRVSHKLFESKHAQDIQKNAIIPNDVPKKVATSAANPELFYFLSLELMQVEIVNFLVPTLMRKNTF